MSRRNLTYQYTGTNPHVSNTIYNYQTYTTNTTSIPPGQFGNTGIQLSNPGGNYVLKINTDGSIETPWGNTSIQETMEILNLIKLITMELAKDDTLADRLPMIREVAYKWLVGSLKK